MKKYLLTLSACLFASSAFVAHAKVPNNEDVQAIGDQTQTNLNHAIDTYNLGKGIYEKTQQGKSITLGDAGKIANQTQVVVKAGRDTWKVGKKAFTNETTAPAA